MTTFPTTDASPEPDTAGDDASGERPADGSAGGSPWTGPSAFGRRLLVIIAVGAVIRLVYVLWLSRVGGFMIGDSHMYHREGLQVADGVGWVNPLLLDVFGVRREQAMHPPAYPLWLALWSKVGLTSHLAHQLVTVPVGLGTIAALGALGRRLVSPRVGLVAAAIAAVHPSIWSWEGMILQEPMGILAATLLTLAMVGLVHGIDARSVALAGLAAGFAPLTRAELLAAVALCLVVVLAVHRSWRSLVAGVAVGLTMLACIAPWAIHNSLRFSRPVALSNGLGVTMAGTHCDELAGDLLGFWSIGCADAAVNVATEQWLAEHPDAERIDLTGWISDPLDESAPPQPAVVTRMDYFYPELDEAEIDARMLDNTVEWMKDHPGYVARSVAARYGRVLGVYRPLQQMGFDELPEGRKRPVVVGAWLGYYLLLPFVVTGAGLLVRRRRWAELVVVVAPAAAALSVIALTFGNTRYRALAEPGMALLAAVGLVAAVSWVRDTWFTDSGDAPPGTEPAEARP